MDMSAYCSPDYYGGQVIDDCPITCGVCAVADSSSSNATATDDFQTCGLVEQRTEQERCSSVGYDQTDRPCACSSRRRVAVEDRVGPCAIDKVQSNMVDSDNVGGGSSGTGSDGVGAGAAVAIVIIVLSLVIVAAVVVRQRNLQSQAPDTGDNSAAVAGKDVQIEMLALPPATNTLVVGSTQQGSNNSSRRQSFVGDAEVLEDGGRIRRRSKSYNETFADAEVALDAFANAEIQRRQQPLASVRRTNPAYAASIYPEASDEHSTVFSSL